MNKPLLSLIAVVCLSGCVSTPSARPASVADFNLMQGQLFQMQADIQAIKGKRQCIQEALIQDDGF
jgi:hypothetical protein